MRYWPLKVVRKLADGFLDLALAPLQYLQHIIAA